MNRDNLSNSEKTWAEYSSDLLNTDKQIEDGRKLYSDLLSEKQQLIESENSWNHQVSKLYHPLYNIFYFCCRGLIFFNKYIFF